VFSFRAADRRCDKPMIEATTGEDDPSPAAVTGQATIAFGNASTGMWFDQKEIYAGEAD